MCQDRPVQTLTRTVVVTESISPNGVREIRSMTSSFALPPGQPLEAEAAGRLAKQYLENGPQGLALVGSDAGRVAALVDTLVRWPETRF